MASPPRSPSSSSSSSRTSSPYRWTPRRMQNRINATILDAPFQDPDWGDKDLKLILILGDDVLVTMDVHRRVLSEKSGYFAEMLMSDPSPVTSLDFRNSADADIYVETLVLMYREDLKKEFVGLGVDKALRLLNVCGYLKFAAGVQSCLEHLEAIPWTVKEEDIIVSVLGRFQTHPLNTEVLQRRLTREPFTTSGANDLILQVMNSVLKAEDEKARRRRKSLLSSLLKSDVVSEEVPNQLCQKCLFALIGSSQCVANMDANMRDARDFKSEIAREADNLLWVVEILIDKKHGNEFVNQWANQKELADLHQRIPPKHRYNISRITAHLCTSMARRFILVPCEQRYSLLDTWMEALYADFEWMSKYGRNFDRNFVEEGLCQIILTLSMEQQESILMKWSNRFANKGDHCPRLQKAFELWWRRAFLSETAAGEQGSSNFEMTFSIT